MQGNEYEIEKGSSWFNDSYDLHQLFHKNIKYCLIVFLVWECIWKTG